MNQNAQEFIQSSDEMHSSLMHAIPDAVCLKDGRGHLLMANTHAHRLCAVGWCKNRNIETNTENIKMCVMHQTCLLDDEDIWSNGKTQIVKERVIEEDGNEKYYEIHKTPVYKSNGDRQFMAVVTRDVTCKNNYERVKRIYDKTLESSDAILITNEHNHIVKVNQSFTRMTGYSPEEVIGQSPAILKSGRQGKVFYQAMWKSLMEKHFWEGEVWDRRKNGEVYPKWLSVHAVAGGDGEVHNYVGTFRDLTEHKETEEEIHRLAFYDPLTNLPNRRMFNQQLDKAIASSNRYQHYGALLMIDVDNFKLINDTKGHPTGDLLLIEVANRLKSCCRAGDSFARLGGDEFVILLEFLSDDLQQAMTKVRTVGEKLLKAMSYPFLIAETELRSSVSIGVGIFTSPNASQDEALKQADIAMYEAKASGRNAMCFFDVKLHESLEKRVALEVHLSKAIFKNQLKLYYQAQVNQSNKTTGAEVLLRWEHPQHGLVPPDDFIPLAEETGLILEIGDWVMRAACKQLKAWESNPLTQHLQISVNVSGKQFNQPTFVEQVKHILKDSNINSSLLKFELTESLMMHNVTHAIQTMDRLRDVGIRFSIDDFGTGYSSLSYLRRLPISQVKIDRSFVQYIDINEGDSMIVQTIIGMANNLGFNVIAEGVETESQRAILEQHGCLEYQGYLFSKPVPLEDFEATFSHRV